MIRFVYIGNQITDGESEFAFFDTIKYQILDFDGEQVFVSRKDFADYKHKELYDRCERLIPKDIK